jgi:ribose transport system permease protein
MKVARIIAFFRRHYSIILPLVLLVILVVVFAISSDAFLTTRNVSNILRHSAVLLIVAAGATFIILQGSIDLSVASIVKFSGICAALLVKDWNIGLWAIPAAMLLGAMAGAINGVVFSYGKVPSFLVTLGTLSIINGLALMLCEGKAITIPFDSIYRTASSGTLVGTLPNIILWSFGVCAVMVLVGRYTRFGRYMYAIGGGEKVARLSGVPVDRFKFYAFIMSGLLSGLAGALMAARVGSGGPGLGEGLLLDSIAAVVIGGTALTGGVGGPHRTILGVLIVGILSNGLDINAVHSFHQEIIKGSIVILAVFLTIDRSKIQIMK